MLVYPAIDLRGGAAVQLVGGDPAQQRHREADALIVARRWIEVGFKALHLIDLDAALGEGDNRDIVKRVLGEIALPTQVGGGVRRRQDVAELLAAGASRVIVGTRAILDPDWLARVVTNFPDRLVVAADARGDRVVTHGWKERTELQLAELLRQIDSQPLAGVLVTDVDREGSMQGIDAEKFANLCSATRHPLIAAGGIATMEDLRRLLDARVAGAVLGMSLYSGRLDPTIVVETYAEGDSAG